ncbi:hypothetical protein [Muricoccus vinaceus]|uniref:Uncharacterized protein n=1 Tax=Muricoccus vinaceus TaxID=424704 RepID=A0ABV6IVU9_9PROT
MSSAICNEILWPDEEYLPPADAVIGYHPHNQRGLCTAHAVHRFIKLLTDVFGDICSYSG